MHIEYEAAARAAYIHYTYSCVLWRFGAFIALIYNIPREVFPNACAWLLYGILN